MTNNKSKQLETESIPKLMWKYSIPTIIAALTIALYNVVDRIFIGQGVGPLAISGLSLTFPIMNILGAFGMLIGQGASSQISLYLGRHDIKTANHILGNALVLNTIISLIVGMSLLIFLNPILYAFGGSEATLPYAKEYLIIILPLHVVTSLAYSLNNMMRASGFPLKAMIALVVGTGINFILDPLFIFVFKMGIQGAAIATVISMFISSCIVFLHFTNKNQELHFEFIYFKLHKKIISKIISIGLSPFLMALAASMVNVIMNKSLYSFGGDLAVGAFGIISSYSAMVVMGIIGLNNGTQPIIGYNYGARQYDRVRKTVNISVIIGSVITAFGCILAWVSPQTIGKLFTSDPQLIDITAFGSRIVFSCFAIVGCQIVMASFFQSIGRARLSILLSLLRQIICLTPCILILPHFFGLTGVFLGHPISDVIAWGFTIYYYRKELKNMHKLELTPQG